MVFRGKDPSRSHTLIMSPKSLKIEISRNIKVKSDRSQECHVKSDLSKLTSPDLHIKRDKKTCKE